MEGGLTGDLGALVTQPKESARDQGGVAIKTVGMQD